MLLRSTLLICAALLGCALGSPSAKAQQLLVLVNGDPITSYDVAQRIRMHQLLERKSMGNKEALEELIDERLKIQQARRLTVEIDDADVERMYAGMAQRSGRTPQQLTESLAQSGLDARTFKSKLRADYIWSQYVRSRSGAVMVRDQDVVAALKQRGETELTATEYQLRPIVFVVPRGGNAAGRLSDANALRGRFTDCDSGIEIAKGMREVVVRPPVLRLSSEMPQGLRQLLDKTEVGRLTPPEVTQTGVEIFAVCDKRQVKGESSAKREIKDQLTTSQFNVESKKLLQDLRKQAMIQYR